MQSMASLMSVNNNSDIAPLDDFDNEDIPEDVEDIYVKSMDEILDISAQLDFMTSSLTENELPSTPISGIFYKIHFKVVYILTAVSLSCMVKFH